MSLNTYIEGNWMGANYIVNVGSECCYKGIKRDIEGTNLELEWGPIWVKFWKIIGQK